jgi:hypothetical protein
LLDDPQFQGIDRRMGRFNLFEAMGAVRAELRHSNFLGFLLSPARNHGCGALVLRALLRGILARMPEDQRPVRSLEVLVGDLENAVVHREWNNIDLFIEIHNLNLVVAIENKIDEKASEGQLLRYKNLVRGKYPVHRHLFVFLTPEGVSPDDADYVSFSYVELAHCIRGIAERKPETASDVMLILRHYIEMLRRHIVPDEELHELARRIYERHKEALDFIFEVRPKAEGLLAVVRALLDNQPGLIQDRHGSNLLRFAPDSWATISELNACPPSNWTKTGRNVLFEIKTWAAGPYADRVIVALLDGPAPADTRERLYAGAIARPDLFRGLVKPMGKQWSTIYMHELLTPAAAKDMELEQKAETIEANWNTFLNDDLPLLNEAIAEIINSSETSSIQVLSGVN